MQSSRDSSVLRSLAIAFGDGLAFGVGMKITQQAAREKASLLPALPEPELLDRIEEIERRVQKVEKLPAAIVSASPGQPIDSKVLEAVVGALDARLAEQTTQTERRLRDLEAKLVIELQTLHKQDHSVATGLQERMAELHEQFSGQVGEIRQQSETAHASYRTELAALHRQFALETAKAVESGLSAKDAQFQQRVDTLHSAVEEQTRTALARHQILEAGLAAQGAGVAARIEGLRKGLAAEGARAVEESLTQSRAAVNQQVGELRSALDQHAQTSGARHLALETSVANHASSLAQRIDETRTAASADAAQLLEAALARNNAEIANQLADLHATLDEHARTAASRQTDAASHLAAVQSAFDEHVHAASARQTDAAAQHAVLQAAFDEQVRAAAAREAEQTAHWEARIAALHQEFAATASHLIGERVAQAIEEQVAPLRAQLEGKDRELQQLRAKVSESDRHAANLFLAIGQACRDAAERIAPPVPDSEAATAPEGAAAGSDEGLPGFVQSKPPGKLLRIPLVSSMAMAIALGATLLHYL